MDILGDPTPAISLKEQCKAARLDPSGLPRHVAIVMDGNGRWAKNRFQPRIFGHRKGVETFKKVITYCTEFNIHYLTVYAFSTENWKRPKKEVSFLMKLLKEMAEKELPELMEKGARIKAFGDLSALATPVRESLEKVVRETEKNTIIQVNIMINYGSRAELLRGIKTLAQEVQSGQRNLEDITEESFSNTLYTAGIPDPDILIRPGGEYRISNFLLWQLSYSELFFIPTLWPDFSRNDLVSVLQEFQKRHRRFGGL